MARVPVTTPAEERGADAPGVVLPGSTAGAFRDVRAFLRARGDVTGMDDVVTWMRESARGPVGVVVVGEVGRGKSSVVNALLDAPGLSPVGIGETTGGFLRFVAATPELPVGRAALELGDGVRMVPVAELADWICIGRQGPDQAPAVGGTVAVERPLPDAVLVDTPGANGLDESHARLAIGQAERAAVLLLVTDVTAPLTTPALDFLEACAHRVAAVVVAVNKIDQSRFWRDRVAENTALLAARGFPDVPVVGVSALAAAAADEADDPLVAERAAAAGRLHELRAALDDVLARADVLPIAGALRAMLGLVGPIIERMQQDRRAAVGDPDAVAELDARTVRLEELQDARAGLRFDWDAASSRLRRELEDEVDHRVEALAARWEARLGDHRWGVSQIAQATLTVDLVADVAVVESDLTALFAERFGALVREMYAAVAIEPGPELLLELSRDRRPAASSTAPVDTAADLDLSVVMPGILGYNLAAGLAGALGVGGAAAGAAVTVAGGAGALVLVGAGMHVRTMQKRKANLVAFLRDRRASLTRRMTRAYSAGFDVVRSTVVKDFERRLTAELTATREQRDRARRMASESEARRAEVVAQLDHDLRAAAEVRARVERALAELLA